MRVTRQLRFWAGVRSDGRELNRLVWPIIISRLGILGLFLADFIMVGHYDAEHIAWLGLGMTPATVFVPVIIGLLMGTMVLVTRAYGAGEYRLCGAIWRQSLPYALAIGLAGMVFCAGGEWMLLAMGQTPDLAREAGRVSLLVGLSLPFMTLGMTSGFFLEGLGRVRPVMVFMLLANILNVGLNMVLIYGTEILPGFGAAGAVAATGFARAAMTLGLLAYIWWTPFYAQFGVRQRPPADARLAGQHRRIGYAGGISLGVEHLAFAGLTVFAGWLGTTVVAAHSIAMNFFGLCFMFGLGIGTATSVRVGHAYGAGRSGLMQRAVWFGLAVQMTLMVAVAIGIKTWDVGVAGLYTRDGLVQPLAGALLAYVSLALCLDTGQVLMAQCLRVSGDVWTPSAIHVVAYLGVALPGSWLFAFPLGHGAYGLMEGFMLGAGVAFFAGVMRFVWRMRRLRLKELSFAPAPAE